MNAAVTGFGYSIRPMSMPDVPTVSRIEERAYDFPWSENIFRDCLRAGYAGYVFENESVIFGYGMLSVAVGEAHLLNLCVDPDMQGAGYGNQMLDYLIERSLELGAKQMYLEVRLSNYAAQHLYHRAGFNEVGLRRNYYRAAEGREHAMVFAKELV